MLPERVRLPAPLLVSVPVPVAMLPEAMVSPIELNVRFWLVPPIPPERVRPAPEFVAMVVAWPSVMAPAQELLPV